MAALVLGVALLWTKTKPLRFTTPVAALLSILDLVALGLGVVALGRWGAVILVGANVASFLIWGVVAASEVEANLTFAATQANVDVSEMQRVRRVLDLDKDLTTLGPRRRAKLIALLADHGRDPDEILDMAPSIAHLWIVHRPAMAWLVDSFDTLIRAGGRPASSAASTADTLAVATQRSATGLCDVIEALIAAHGGTLSTLPKAA